MNETQYQGTVAMTDLSAHHVTLPLRASETDLGVIVDATGADIITIDVNNTRPDDQVRALALIFADAINFAGTPAPPHHVEIRVAQLEAILAAEEARSEELLKRLDKAREGKEPDFCYDPDEWEFTSDWEDRDQVHGHGEALHSGKVMQVATLIRGPRKWVAEVPVTWTEAGDPDETEIRWFDSEEAALAAFVAPASEGSDA
ncbi:MAG TPA: hypothetical protein VL202_00330 [Pararhizobium sp.]|uniref:hypothetical protein n=1 Tax=Pararhizobium sp. TaxID=1977563 RepID=UPI002C52C704|nr:hypothetical protein [Pararhizobium sp.]HTO29616.1 hypothetical protein [Pararhizobium sp.]